MDTPAADRTDDAVARSLLHPLFPLGELADGAERTTRLLGEPITVRAAGAPGADGAPTGLEARAADGAGLAVEARFGYLWASFDPAPRPLFEIPEWAEPDRRGVHAATVAVRTSAPRAVENFLDMGHFPFVHTDILGAEPHTEVREYDVSLDEAAGEILATNCQFQQPRAAVGSTEAMLVHYVYRVPHPYCALLYKSCPSDLSRQDVIGLFVQPTSEVTVRAHAWLCVHDPDSTDTALKLFQQTIFGQDKPILENQQPARLPLDPRAETPIRADRMAVVYRRWLQAIGLRYGTLPAPA